jgi:hypothetical protein
MTKLTIETPTDLTSDDLAMELVRITRMVEEGYTSGEIQDGWWNLTGLAPDEPTANEKDILAEINAELPAMWNVQKQANGMFAAFYGDGYRKGQWHSPEMAGEWILEHTGEKA